MLAGLAALLLAGCGYDEAAAREAFEALSRKDTPRVLALLDEHDLTEATGPLFLRDQGKPGRSAFHLVHAAAYAHDADVLARLVEQGADVNQAGPNGITPLDMICGAWPRRLTQDEKDILAFRTARKQPRALRFLLDHGAKGKHYQREMGIAIRRSVEAAYADALNDPGVRNMDMLIRGLQRR